MTVPCPPSFTERLPATPRLRDSRTACISRASSCFICHRCASRCKHGADLQVADLRPGRNRRARARRDFHTHTLARCRRTSCSTGNPPPRLDFSERRVGELQEIKEHVHAGESEFCLSQDKYLSFCESWRRRLARTWGTGNANQDLSCARRNPTPATSKAQSIAKAARRPVWRQVIPVDALPPVPKFGGKESLEEEENV